MKFRSVIAAAAAISLGVVGLAACSSGGQTGGTATSITVWHNSADSPAVLDLYKNFTKATGIKVNLVSIPSDSFETTTQTKWATGDRPDILEYHPTLSALLALNPAQNMQDLTSLPFVKKSGDLYPVNATVDGKTYGAVTGFPSVFGLYYSKAAFQKAGIGIPTSFADLAADCTALKAAGIAPFYESGASLWPTQILPLLYLADANKGDVYGERIAANKEKLNDPAGPFVKALTAYSDLERQGCFNGDASTGTFEKALAAVYDGTAAMTALHSDAYTQLLQAAGGDAQKTADAVGFIGISATSATGTYAGGPIGTFYAPKTGKSGQEAAAIKFIQYATGDGYGKMLAESKQFPVISGYPDPTGITSLQQSYKTVYDHSTLGFNSNIAGFAQFATEMGKLLNKQATPQQVADDMEAAVAQASKAAGIAGW